VRDGEGWRISGTKIWSSHAHASHYAYVLARSDAEAPKHESLTEFIVDLHGDGVDVRPILDLRGEHHFNELILEDVRVPDRWVLGRPGNGWEQVTTQLAFERGGAERFLSTYPILEQTIERCRADGMAEHVVGTLLVRLRAVRSLAWDVALALDRGEAPAQRAAMLKLLGTELERDVTEACRPLLGVAPAPDGVGVAGLLGDGILAAPGFSIRGGTSEVLLGIDARAETAA
jgi:alkylation response protein AidB-like acyl-CoA dehydrogenase